MVKDTDDDRLISILQGHGPIALEIEESAGFDTLRAVCLQVKRFSGSSFGASIHLGIGDVAVDLLIRLGGTPDISIYEDATAIEGANLTIEGVDLRAQRPNRPATPKETELLQQAKRPTLRIIP
jgi:hypothetical protein